MRKLAEIITLLLALAFSADMCAKADGNAVSSPVHLWKGMKVRGSRVTLTPYLPANGSRPRTAVIVCPGGSYFWLAKETEGTNVARWLQENGIAAFVLQYRTAGIPAFAFRSRLLIRGHRHPDMIQDAQRAIQYVREHCDELNIDNSRVGVMGFSAGGHLAAMTAEYGGTNFLTLVGIHPEVSLRPDFVALIYPVVSFADKSMHKRSRRGLLGEWKKNNKQMCDSLSMEKHVSGSMPPVFLVNCKDDPTVKYHNSELLDSALTAANARHRYIQYETGGHGFGATPEKTSEEAIHWKEEFLEWLDGLWNDVRTEYGASSRN